MAAVTFTHTTTGGGTWEDGTNWSSNPDAPDSTSDVFITLPGTYTVAVDGTDQANSVTLNAPTATLAVDASGQLLGGNGPITLQDGTFTVSGILNHATVVNPGSGAVVNFNSGTLDGVVWDGAFAQTGTSTFGIVNIAHGITVNDAASTGPGTIDISTLYTVNVLDAATLDHITIAMGNYNNEYLNGPQALTMTLGNAGTLVQAAGTASASIGGLQFDNLGMIRAASTKGSMYLGPSTFNNDGSLIIPTNDTVQIASNFNNNGTVAVTASGTLAIGSGGTAENSTTISLSLAAELLAQKDIGGSGVISLASLATADMHNVTGTVLFKDNQGFLKLESASNTPFSYTGSIAGFQKGDTIDLPHQSTVTSLDLINATSADGTLAVMNSTTTIAALHLLGDYTTGYTFGHVADGGSGTNITVACYAAGTRLLTARGEVAVEALREDDLLATASGAMRPARWIGRTRIDLDRRPRAASVAPIRVRAGAFGEAMPHRDLLLSPDHAVATGAALVPAHQLVNGVTVVREPSAGSVDYFHVELDRHDLLLAEGLVAESFLDTGNRHGFVNSSDAVAGASWTVRSA